MVHGVHVKTFIETQNEATGRWTCIDTDKFTFVAAKKTNQKWMVSLLSHTIMEAHICTDGWTTQKHDASGPLD